MELDERAFRQILDVATDAIVAVDEAQRIVFFNRGAEQLFGYRREDVLGASLDLLLPPRFHALHRRAVSEFGRSPEVARLMGSRGEIRCRRRDGTEVPAEASIAKIAVAGRQFFLAVLRETTERRAREAALQRLATELAASTGDRVFADMAAFLAEALGVERAFVGELLDPGGPGAGSRVRTLAAWAAGELVAPFEYALAATPCERVIREGVQVYAEGVRPRFPADGRLAAWQAEAYAGAPLIGPAGRTAGLIAAVGSKPLTRPHLAATLLPAFAARAAAELERLALERALAEQGQFFEELFENAPEAIVLLDRDRRVMRFNREFGRLFGYTLEEARSRPIDDLVVPPEYRDEARAFAQTVMSGRGVDAESVRRRKNGDLVAVSILSSSVRLRGEQVGVYVVYRDLTERKRLEERVLQAEKLDTIGRLAGGVAHDFNNLLTAILGYADLVAAELGEDHPLRPEVAEIRAAAERGADLTRQLLAFGRRQRLQPALLNLNGIVRGLEPLLRRLIPESVRMVLDLDGALGMVEADPTQLEQVVLNLALNARDAMPSGGTLTLRTRNAELDARAVPPQSDAIPGPYVVLDVIDTGVGMDDATRRRVFEPFFTTKGPGQGTGLGLATVYGIVKQSGGCVEVESAPGEGSCFSVYLPRRSAPVEAAPVPEAMAPAVQSGGGPGTVLLVEDDPSVRLLARRVLEGAGCRVLEAPGSREALELASRSPEPIDLLLTDIVLPEMSGYELADRLGRCRPGLRVVLMSGYADDVAGARPGTAPAGARLVEKPFRPDGLVRVVLEALGVRGVTDS